MPFLLICQICIILLYSALELLICSLDQLWLATLLSKQFHAFVEKMFEKFSLHWHVLLRIMPISDAQ